MPTHRNLLAHFGVFLAVVVLAFSAARPALAAEEILDFLSHVIVRPDGVLDVTEKIKVRAEGDQIKRGIYRDFPLTFVDGDGGNHQVSFKLISVMRDGKPEPNHTNKNTQGVRIYFGEQDVFLRPGVYTYTIHYETGRQIRFLPDHTELFWNVTGNEWAFPILRAGGLFELPRGAAPVRWTAYTGPYGAKGTDFTGTILGDNALSVTTTQTLPPNQGLSVVLQIPDGLIAEPSGTQALYYWFLDNRRFVFGGLGLFGVLLFYLVTWSAVGRDPPKGVIIPLFHPPPGISPALAGYVNDWGWGGGWRTFTAAAISLAVKGLLIFDDSGADIVLKRTEKGRSIPSDLPPGEKSILKWVSGRGGHVTINKDSGKSVATAQGVFRESVEAENHNRFFRRNVGYVVVGAGLTIAALVIVLLFGGLNEGEIGALFGVGFVSVFLGFFIVPVVRALFGARGVQSVVVAALNIVVLVAILGGIGSTFISSFSLPDDFANSIMPGILANAFPFVLVGGFAAMNGLFYYLLRAPTAAGRKVMDQIEGLELYIRTAETARLNAAGAPDLDATQFERLLPYAIALKAEKPWSEAFAAAFARANPGRAMEVAYAPSWHNGVGWSGHSFGSSLASSVSAAQGSFASSLPAPSSSSSGFSGGGGGGGSGGGGGGGGGGGW